MASLYTPGACIILSVDEQPVFCEVVDYQGHGLYYVSLTRGIVDRSASKFPNLMTIHESVLQELHIEIEESELT